MVIDLEKKVVIIGAGVARLSAGCYARMHGYDAEIHEAHTIPAGLCTSWKRKYLQSLPRRPGLFRGCPGCILLRGGARFAMS
jgi:thioredoxin reductase